MKIGWVKYNINGKKFKAKVTITEIGDKETLIKILQECRTLLDFICYKEWGFLKKKQDFKR